MAEVAVIFEFSGIVRDAFAAYGHNAESVDLLPTDAKGSHYQMDAIEYLEQCSRKDLIIAHPPCTALTVAGNGTYANTRERAEAIEWTAEVWNLLCAKADAVCMENPIGVLSTQWRKPSQYIQPWNFGDLQTKNTCLWLKGLPPLVKWITKRPPNVTEKVWLMSPGPERSKLRSLFFAAAMAAQWTPVIESRMAA